MTQALNLANFANKLNTSGQTDNTGLQNSSVTVTAGTGMSGGGAVALGSSVTLNNAGVTSVAAGTGISVSATTGGITITNTSPGGGGVTSVATGNGLQGGTITGSGTLSIACPAASSVGAYAFAYGYGYSAYYDGNYSGGTLNLAYIQGDSALINTGAPFPGTWKWLGGSGSIYGQAAIICRIA